MSDNMISKYDAWLRDDSQCAALVIREHLMPVEGHDGVVFPPTFAATEDKKFEGGYNIDVFPDGSNTCLIDSVGSQANRIEPLFARKEYSALVPQVVIQAGENKVSILEASHRAGDAILRCSPLKQRLQDAFKALLKGDAEPIAKIAPTSVVFGAWDSRDTQAKAPRLVASTIRAYNVRKLTRSAQYTPSAEYVNAGMLPEPADDRTAKLYTKQGFIHVPSSAVPGGIIADGGIRRDASLHLAAARLLRTAKDSDKTIALRRYVFGLALTAFTHPVSGYLRQGCCLVLDPDKPREFAAVWFDGRREPLQVTHAQALEFAQMAAKAFGVGPSETVQFDTEAAKRDISGENGDGEKGKKAASKKGK